MLTGIKDLDYKILNELGDKDLVNVCLVNKNASEICDDQTFWLNRILSMYPNVPSEVLVKSKKGRSWSDYYIKDLRLLNTMEPNEILIDGAERGREDWVMIGLNRGANVHAPDHFGSDAALRWASINGRTEVVKILLEAGADVHAENDLALRIASYYGHTEVVITLLKAGANVHAPDHIGPDAALRWASKYGHSEVVKLLEQYM